jgi:hypothetical protein
MVSYFVALLFAFQQPAAPATPAPAPPVQAPPAQTQPRRPAAAAATATSTLQIRVVDRVGTPIGDAQVIAEGPLRRAGTTAPDGTLTMRTVTNGTYRVRAESEGFVPFEKEVVVRAGAAAAPVVELALTEAPEPPPVEAPPPPAPEPPPAAPAATAGEARTVSIPDLAERSLSGRDPVRTVPIGCSGLSRTQLLVVRETHTSPVRPDEDEMLYLVAGEATLKLGDREQSVAPGSFSIVPRGTTRSVTRKGRNPAILLSTVSGQPCGAGSDR